MSPVNSMTGFGRAEQASDLGTISVEAKSVNHRYSEIKVYLPRELSSLELPLTRIVKDKLSRGKIDVSIRWTPSPQYAPHANINVPLLERYEVEIAHIAGNLQRHERVPMEFLLSLPGVMEKASSTPDEMLLLALASSALTDALDALIEQRRREGEALAIEIGTRINNLESLRQGIAARTGEVVEEYRVRLAKKAEEWAQSASIQLEPGRLEAEVLMFADRSDVTEELVRLEAHIRAFQDSLSKGDREPQGRGMDFLTQELLRETNTIASKSKDTGIASTVLTMKNEIEKIKEQVLNIE